MKKHILLLCMLALTLFSPTQAQLKNEDEEVKSVYIVQAKNITELYDDSIVKELKRRNPHYNLKVLFARGYESDQFYFSKEFTEREILKRSESYDKLVLLGYALSDLNIGNRKPVHIPILVTSVSGKHGPASPKSIASGIVLACDALDSVNPTMYVISDYSDFSKLRLSQFKAAIESKPDLTVVPVTVKNVVELRSSLVRLNRKPKAFIVNNTFNLVDQDSATSFFASSTNKILTEFNTQHVEVGILRWDQRTALGFGALPMYLAAIIEAEINGEDYSRELQVGVNLDRISLLDIDEYVLNNSKEIVYFTVDDL